MLFSIIIATYNRVKQLPLVVESILAQTYSEWELVIVDDGSSDTTKEYLDSLTDKRIRSFYLEKNSGAYVARNKGIDESRGEYIIIWDSDDFLYPYALNVLADYLTKHPTMGLLYAPTDFYQGEVKQAFPERESGPVTFEELGTNRLPKNDAVIAVQRKMLGNRRFLGPNIDFTFYVRLVPFTEVYHINQSLGKVILLSDEHSETKKRKIKNPTKSIVRAKGYEMFLNEVGERLASCAPERYAGVCFGAALGFLLEGKRLKALSYAWRAFTHNFSFSYAGVLCLTLVPGSSAFLRWFYARGSR